MIITIDGPAGSGKSTVAGLLAKKLGFIHFNSGALFRGVTAFLANIKFDIENINSETVLPSFDLETKMINNTQHVFVNNKDFTPVLRENMISQFVAYVALNKDCREKVDNCQRTFASNNNVVIEGRDIGSHVFPNADFKFYLDCSIQERARRRFLEVYSKNSNITLEEIEKQLAERDYLDKTRKTAPLIIPKNAIMIDSTTLTIDEVVEKMYQSIVKNK